MLLSGWIKDAPDERDMWYAAPSSDPSIEVDLSHSFPVAYDQGELNSCTANGVSAVVQFERTKQHLIPDFIPSRLFLYYNIREIENTVSLDKGAGIRNGIKSMVRQGDCSEDDWPYDITEFANRPPIQCYEKALKYRAVEYYRLHQNIRDMKGSLSEGYPFVFGFVIFESFKSKEVERTGIVPMPKPSEMAVINHCGVAVGYDNSHFIVRNSWGPGWGEKGYCRMPYEYLTNSTYCGDFWNIKLLSN